MADIIPPPPGFANLRPLKTAGANPAWETVDMETNMPCVLLHAHPGTYIILDPSDFPTVQTIGTRNASHASEMPKASTASQYEDAHRAAGIGLSGDIHPMWFMTTGGYAAAHFTYQEKNSTYLLHRFLVGAYDAGAEEERAVIHINGNHADCRRANLAYASHTQLNRRRPKPAKRQEKAKPLPAGIVQTDLPRYCTYYYEKCYPFSPAKPRYRSFFRVEQHPLQLAVAAGLIQDARIQPIYASTKAAGVADAEKLAQAQAYAHMLTDLVAEYPDIYERLEHYTRAKQEEEQKKSQ